MHPGCHHRRPEENRENLSEIFHQSIAAECSFTLFRWSIGWPVLSGQPKGSAVHLQGFSTKAQYLQHFDDPHHG
jgi:hypothetical protein